MAKQTSQQSQQPAVAGGFNFGGLVSHTEIAEGGGFGPTSFRGTIIAAGYMPHRFMSDPPKPDQNPAYFLTLWAKFRVDEVLDAESGYDPDDHPEGFDHYGWKLGGKSLQWFFSTNDTHTPAGISGGFDELALMAVGKTEGGDLITFTDPIEATRGRWFMVRPGVPESKGKLEGKSGYAVFLRESVPAVEAVDPSLIVSYQTKKGDVEKTFNVNGIGPDKMPMGAQFFVGLSGVWDTKKIDLGIINGAPSTQRVLYLTSFDGREEISGEGDTDSAPAPAAAKPAAATAAKGKAPAAKPAAATPAPAASPAADDDADSDEPQDLDSRIKRAILAALPVSGAMQQQQLALAVVRDSGKFDAAEKAAAAKAFTTLIKEAPSKTDAQSLVDMGIEVYYTFETSSQTVERYTAQ